MRAPHMILATLIYLITTPCGNAQQREIDGIWVGQTLVAPSQYSAGNEDRARAFLQKLIKIEGDRIHLPDLSVCKIYPASFEYWQNNMMTFGSFGGNWSKIGLIKAESGYAVTSWKVGCADKTERLRQIVAQPESNTILLDFGRIFVVLK